MSHPIEKPIEKHEPKPEAKPEPKTNLASLVERLLQARSNLEAQTQILLAQVSGDHVTPELKAALEKQVGALEEITKGNPPHAAAAKDPDVVKLVGQIHEAVRELNTQEQKLMGQISHDQGTYELKAALEKRLSLIENLTTSGSRKAPLPATV